MTRRHAIPASRRTSLRAGRKSGRGGTLLGVFIGLALGLGLAAGVAFWLMRAPNPYQASAAREPSRDLSREPAKTGKLEAGAIEKPRFDFYKILPGAEEPKVQQKAAERPAPDKATVDRAAEKPVERTVARAEEPPARAQPSSDRFWLQAGSFTAESDAENLRARLALAGWEAAVQTASVPDKGVRYRVRLGPYDNADELNRIKGELGKRGFDVAVIKY